MKSILSYCSKCCRDNFHEVKHVEAVDEEYDYPSTTKYFMLRCLGCGGVSFRQDYHDYSASFENEDGEIDHVVLTKYFPPILAGHRGLKYAWKLPKPIVTIYSDSINALKSDCKLLSGVGFRAVIEAICIDKEINVRNLESSINNLAKQGFITKKECERLHSVRFLGNDSIHEMKVPEINQLKTVLDIIEQILRNLYLLDYEVEKNLETPITDFEGFIGLLNKNLKNSQIGDDIPIIQILGKDYRRVKENILQFESTLLDKIKIGSYDKLATGEIKQYRTSPKNTQHFIILQIPN